MTAEPLWRGKLEHPRSGRFRGSCGAIDITLCASPGTEVEVWPAGDRTCPYVETGDEGTSYCRLAEAGDRPTREQIEHAMRSWLVRSGVVTFNWRDEDEAVQGATDAVWALLHGQGDETEEEHGKAASAWVAGMRADGLLGPEYGQPAGDLAPPPEPCHDKGPRIGNEGSMYCVLPKGHAGEHEGDPSWRQYGGPNDAAGNPPVDSKPQIKRQDVELILSKCFGGGNTHRNIGIATDKVMQLVRASQEGTSE